MKCCSLDLRLYPLQSSRLHSQFRVRDQLSSVRSKETNALSNGRLYEYDVVELQIRAIIEMARKQREEVTALELGTVKLGSPLGFSVKRSVKRFLEKRKKRTKSVTETSSTSSSYNF